VGGTLGGKEVIAVRPMLDLIRRQLMAEDEDGQTLVEYGLLLALIVLVVFAALILLGPIVSGFFMDMGDTITDVT
jgi:pilus assembly protein Flp/PilA